MNKNLIGPIIVSIIIAIYALIFHYLNVSPYDWSLTVIWTLIYVSPIWIIYFLVEIINKNNIPKTPA